jgi:N-acetylmuramic acid 6-phosphate etherase
MVRLGKVYRGLMVHMLPTNEKLRRRAAQIVRTVTGCSEVTAAEAVAKANGDVKTAALVACGMDVGTAQAALAKHEGNLRLAMTELKQM